MPSRILLVHTGGTLGMTPTGDPSTLAPGPSLERILEEVPELKQLADLDLAVPFNQDSTSMEPEDILALADLVKARGPDCDGVVIVHGTDTMAFTASVLGFLLADLGRPVVLTGSQRPLAFIRSDARSNLVDAVTLASRGVNDVGICFGDHWFRGPATDKTSVHRYEAFDSPNLPPLAELGLEVIIHAHAGHFPRQVPPGLGGALEAAIAVHTPHPGAPWPLPGPGIRAVLIQAYGAGNLPVHRADLRALLEHCERANLPLVVTSQCPSGGVNFATYELGRELEVRGAISGGRHTRWAALAKLGLLLGAGAGPGAVREAFATSWAGEPL